MATYQLAGEVPDSVRADLVAHTPLQQQLLFTRGITEAVTAAAFLKPSYDEGLHDPFLLHDMNVAVTSILEAMRNEVHITIFSDYDCDGIPGAVVLHDFFKAVGFNTFTNYIPHRHYEGFGLSIEAVEKIAATGTKLLITIDCGTSNVEAVARATELGISVIITDHHEPGPQLPQATAVVNPKVGDTYPFQELCGAGVVFKMVQALLASGEFAVTAGQEKWWLDMVGIATIADMVPLVGENRIFAQYGLTVLQKSRRPGLQLLLRKQRVNQRNLTEDDIGFTIGPRINAASRMDTPEDAFFLLTTTDEDEARVSVAHLESLNTKRKSMVAQMTKEVHKRMKDLVEMPAVIVLGHADWRPSLVGLTASKLAEEYNRPAFLWGRDGNGVIKGSCRSGGGVSVVRLMEAITDILSEHGGHHFSGGFSVDEAHIHMFPSKLQAAFAALGEAVAIDEVRVIDQMLHLDDISQDFLQAQAALAPFGAGNPKPLYQFSNVTIKEIILFGKTKEHTKLLFETSGTAREAIAFFMKPDQFKKTPAVGDSMTLIAHVEQSTFMGRRQTRLRLVDIL